MRPLKFLVIYENGAGGHRGAALAVAEALADFPPNEVEVRVLELDTLAPRSRKKVYTLLMDIGPYLKPIVRLVFSLIMKPNFFLRCYRAFTGLLESITLRRFLDVVREHNPDLIVSTHFRPNVACNSWKLEGRLAVAVHSVVTDFVAHGVWAQPQIEHYYVASHAVLEDLLRHGVDPGRVTVTGMPVSPSMLRPDPRPMENLKTELGLRPELPVLLIMGGARGDQDYAAILRALEQRQCRAQAVVLCGWNQSLQARIEALAAGLKTLVHVKGFQDNMADWYRVADLIMTKPGGMTTAEAMALGRPLLLLSPHPGKEEAQAERLTRAGAAFLEPTPQAAVEVALHLLDDPSQFQKVQQAALLFSKQDGAQRIAAALVEAARHLVLNKKT